MPGIGCFFLSCGLVEYHTPLQTLYAIVINLQNLIVRAYCQRYHIPETLSLRDKDDNDQETLSLQISFLGAGRTCAC